MENQCEKVRICCLRFAEHCSVGKKSRIFSLEGRHECSIGREGVDLYIPSNMVSRKHAILHKSSDGWTVQDNDSSNGVFINGHLLGKNKQHILRDGDEIRLGIILSDKPPIILTYCTNWKVKKIRIDKEGKPGDASDGNKASACTKSQVDRGKRPLPEDPSEESTSGTKKEGGSSKVGSAQRHVLRKRKSSREGKPSTESCSQGPSHVSPEHKRLRELDQTTESPATKLRQELEAQKQEAEKKLQEQQVEMDRLHNELRLKQEAQEHMEAELRRREEELKEEMKRKEEELEKKRQDMEAELRRAQQEEIEQREQTLRKRLTDEKSRLIQEKERVECELQQQMEQKLEEKDKDLQERLVKEKDQLERVIEQKEVEHLMILSELDAARNEQTKKHEDALRDKEQMLTDMSEIMETELQCSICSELFVQATSLNCAHSFCAVCIERWMKVKKQCPVCRTSITSHTRSLVLDNYIDKMAEHLTPEMREHRKEVVAERKEREVKTVHKAGPNNNNNTTAATTSTDAGVVTRGRGRNGIFEPGNDGVVNYVEEEVIELSSVRDEEDDDDSIDLEDTDSVRGDSDADSYDSDDSHSYHRGGYYGGGRCYNCGRRGHWARDCPF